MQKNRLSPFQVTGEKTKRWNIGSAPYLSPLAWRRNLAVVTQQKGNLHNLLICLHRWTHFSKIQSGVLFPVKDASLGRSILPLVSFLPSSKFDSLSARLSVRLSVCLRV